MTWQKVRFGLTELYTSLLPDETLARTTFLVRDICGDGPVLLIAMHIGQYSLYHIRIYRIPVLSFRGAFRSTILPIPILS